MDICQGIDGSLYVVSISPPKLHIVSVDHMKSKSIELYEYIPSNKGVSLSIFELEQNSICVYNLQENTALIIDIKSGSISPILIHGLEQTRDSCISPGALLGQIAVIYQKNSKYLIFLDFKTFQQSRFLTAFEIQSIHYTKNSTWLVQNVDGSKYYAEISIEYY